MRKGAALLLVFLAGFSQAQVPAAENRFDRGLLWKVTPGGGEPSFLFGTVHSEDRRVLQLPPEVSEALAQARHFAMEVRMEAEVDEAISRSMVYPGGGRTLRDDIGEDLYQRAAAITDRNQVSREDLALLKPWALLMTLSVPKQETGLALDLVLQQQALQRRMDISGLETIGEQLGVFSGLGMDEQRALLADAITRYPQLTEFNEQLLQLYLGRDLAGLLRFAEKVGDGLSPGLQAKMLERLVTLRNRRMAARMQPLLRQGAAFVAVGALHLPGRDGLLRILERMGYGLERLY